MREWEFVELLREYVHVNRTLRSMFARFYQGEPCFQEVARLVGDSESSILFRLKERCHALFRKDADDSKTMHREVLFDLTVGSLFHEAMKLRENLYQHEVYVPRVERLLEEHDPDDGAFFKEFEKVQETGADRTKAAMRETQALLDQTRRQLRALLATHAHNSLMTRNLFENREEVELVFEAPLDQLFSEIHGDQATGYAAAADSYLDSAFFVQAIACIDCALAQKSECTEAQPALISLRKYAAGMDHFSKGEYEASLDSLEGWLDAGADDIDQRPLRFADSALSRFDKLVNGKEDGELRARAVALLERIEKLLSVAPVI